MNWIPDESLDQATRWLAASGAGQYIVDRKLDFLATSMRDLDDVAPQLKNLEAGQNPEHPDSAQRLVDLRRAYLADPNRVGLSELGAAVLRAWSRYGVDDSETQHELPRHILLVLSAIRLNHHPYIELVQYWTELANRFGAENLLTHWDRLYALNYLDTKQDGYAPGEDFRASGSDLDGLNIDLEQFVKRVDPKNVAALNGARRIQRSIAGKIPRGRHRVTSCLAIELVGSNEDRSNLLLDKFGVPKRLGKWAMFSENTKSLTKRILAEDRGAARGLVAAERQSQSPSGASPVRFEFAEALEALSPVEPPPAFELDLPYDFDYASSLVTHEPGEFRKERSRRSRTDDAKPVFKKDYAREAIQNEAVGKAAEKFVFAYEKDKLKSRPELSKKIVWVSETDDSAGFDIVSYTLDGKEIYIEVKGTKGRLDSGFYISINELATAAKLGDSYQIYRVFNLGKSPKFIRIEVPLTDTVDLEPVMYRAIFK